MSGENKKNRKKSKRSRAERAHAAAAGGDSASDVEDTTEEEQQRNEQQRTNQIRAFQLYAAKNETRSKEQHKRRVDAVNMKIAGFAGARQIPESVESLINKFIAGTDRDASLEISMGQLSVSRPAYVKPIVEFVFHTQERGVETSKKYEVPRKVDPAREAASAAEAALNDRAQASLTWAQIVEDRLHIRPRDAFNVWRIHKPASGRSDNNRFYTFKIGIDIPLKDSVHSWRDRFDPNGTGIIHIHISESRHRQVIEYEQVYFALAMHRNNIEWPAWKATDVEPINFMVMGSYDEEREGTVDYGNDDVEDWQNNNIENLIGIKGFNGMIRFCNLYALRKYIESAIIPPEDDPYRYQWDPPEVRAPIFQFAMHTERVLEAINYIIALKQSNVWPEPRLAVLDMLPVLDFSPNRFLFHQVELEDGTVRVSGPAGNPTSFYYPLITREYARNITEEYMKWNDHEKYKQQQDARRNDFNASLAFMSAVDYLETASTEPKTLELAIQAGRFPSTEDAVTYQVQAWIRRYMIARGFLEADATARKKEIQTLGKDLLIAEFYRYPDAHDPSIWWKDIPDQLPVSGTEMIALCTQINDIFDLYPHVSRNEAEGETLDEFEHRADTIDHKRYEALVHLMGKPDVARLSGKKKRGHEASAAAAAAAGENEEEKESPELKRARLRHIPEVPIPTEIDSRVLYGHQDPDGMILKEVLSNRPERVHGKTDRQILEEACIFSCEAVRRFAQKHGEFIHVLIRWMTATNPDRYARWVQETLSAVPNALTGSHRVNLLLEAIPLIGVPNEEAKTAIREIQKFVRYLLIENTVHTHLVVFAAYIGAYYPEFLDKYWDDTGILSRKEFEYMYHIPQSNSNFKSNFIPSRILLGYVLFFNINIQWPDPLSKRLLQAARDLSYSWIENELPAQFDGALSVRAAKGWQFMMDQLTTEEIIQSRDKIIRILGSPSQLDARMDQELQRRRTTHALQIAGGAEALGGRTVYPDINRLIGEWVSGSSAAWNQNQIQGRPPYRHPLPVNEETAKHLQK